MQKFKYQIMADSQKIQPVAADMEAQPPSRFPATNHPPEPPPKTRNSCWCKFICWTISVIFFLLILVAAICGILYLIFKPKIPKYSIDNLKVSNLRLNYDLSLYARFDVKITAYNPNKKIGIYYEKGGRLSVWYAQTQLCAGSIPEFYQGHKNGTKLDVSLSGENQYGNTLMQALQQQQQTGNVPLDLQIDAPVAVKLGKLKLKKVRILGDCDLVVDSLSIQTTISIQASKCKFRLKL